MQALYRENSIMLSREKVIHNNLNKSIILKIDSPKNIFINIRNFDYRAGNISHSYIATILVHTRLHTNIGNTCACEHN